MNYQEVTFILDPLLPAREVLVAELAELGFESFVETDEGVKAYIVASDWNEGLLAELMTSQMEDQKIEWNSSEIEAINWNAEWEKSFDPIIVDNKCLIRAPFHEVEGSFEYVINIEPKMSFGTGHHSTTHLMIGEMMNMDWKGKNVLDMGAGTAVLAILAEMMGAESSDAIDIDEWAYLNSIENLERNNCSRIKSYQGGAELLTEQVYDTILANINRNILLRDMKEYVKVLKTGGEILFSGFYVQDIPELERVGGELGLKLVLQRERNEWCLLKMIK
ncbi:MAG: 50S ribosomal protein L11 methyltransferase [Flavobacteriales bacterium]